MLHFYLPLLLFCIGALITPGPNNIMLMMCASAFGIKPVIPHYLGICCGFALMTAVLGCGLAGIFIKYPYVHVAVKIIGAAYMLYMSWKIITTTALNTPQTTRQPFTFVQAVLFQWANPKALVVILSSIATYTTTSASAPSMLVQVASISLIFFVMCFLSGAIWLFGGTIVKIMIKNHFHFKLFNYTMGFLLIVSIILMLR